MTFEGALSRPSAAKENKPNKPSFESLAEDRNLLLKRLQEEKRISVVDVFVIQDRLAPLANAEELMHATVEILREGYSSVDKEINWTALAYNWMKKHAPHIKMEVI